MFRKFYETQVTVCICELYCRNWDSLYPGAYSVVWGHLKKKNTTEIY